MNHKAHKDHEDEQPTRFAPLPQATERVIHDAIGAALAVHRQLGPGFLESAYERAMRVELAALQIPFECQKQVKVQYRGVVVCDHHLDLVVADAVAVEIKAVRKLRPIHEAQVLSYLKATGLRAGILVNFNVKLLVDGLRRFVR